MAGHTGDVLADPEHAVPRREGLECVGTASDPPRAILEELSPNRQYTVGARRIFP